MLFNRTVNARVPECYDAYWPTQIIFRTISAKYLPLQYLSLIHIYRRRHQGVCRRCKGWNIPCRRTLFLTWKKINKADIMSALSISEIHLTSFFVSNSASWIIALHPHLNQETLTVKYRRTPCKSVHAISSKVCLLYTSFNRVSVQCPGILDTRDHTHQQNC